MIYSKRFKGVKKEQAGLGTPLAHSQNTHKFLNEVKYFIQKIL
jgi:hypothetical protein